MTIKNEDISFFLLERKTKKINRDERRETYDKSRIISVRERALRAIKIKTTIVLREMSACTFRSRDM